MAGGNKQWLASTTAYTLAGGASSAFVGALLGWLGGVLVPGRVGGLGILVALAVAAVAIARELGWLAVPLPQVRRQTRDVWAKAFRGPLAAALWGLDLGLVFTTWLSFSGVWLLVAVAVLAGKPAFGAALFVLHWLGRDLSVWLAPMLLRDASATPRLLDAIVGQHRLFRRIHVVGLGWAVVVLIFWIARGISMSG